MVCDYSKAEERVLEPALSKSDTGQADESFNREHAKAPVQSRNGHTIAPSLQPTETKCLIPSGLSLWPGSIIAAHVARYVRIAQSWFSA